MLCASCDPIGILVAILSGLLLIGGWVFRREPDAGLQEFGKRETLPLRGLLVSFVVLGHMDSMTGREYVLLGAFHWATPAVAVFFFLSGYGLWKGFQSAERTGRTAAYWKSFVVCSPVKLFFPVVILGLVLLLCRCLTGNAVGVRDLVRVVTGKALHNTWFVRTLFLFYMFYFVSFVTLGGRRGMGAVLFGVLGYWIFLKYGCESRYFQRVSCFAFPVGLAFASVENRIRLIVSRRPIFVSLILSLALAVIYALRVPKEILYVFLGPIVATILYFGNGLMKVAALNCLGRHSYEIYLVHGIFQYGFRGLPWSPLVYIGAVVGVTVIVAVPLHLVDVKINGWLRAAIDGVSPKIPERWPN